LHPDVLAYIKGGAEKALVDQHELIRSVAGTIITTIVTRGGIVNWPEILQRYMDMADSPDPIIQEVPRTPPKRESVPLNSCQIFVLLKVCFPELTFAECDEWTE
jgi:hypothetical protein